MNASSDAAPDAAALTNAATLAQLLPDIPAFSWPWLTDLSDDALAEQAERIGLLTAQHFNTTERTT